MGIYVPPGPNEGLKAPLTLPATATGHLTTQGSTTLDDGSGNMTVHGTVTVSGTSLTMATGIVTAKGTNTATDGAAVITPALVSGTAAQLSDTTRDYILYLVVGTAGTITVAIGPTSTPANTVVSAAAATGGELITLRVPAGWYVEVTLVTATLASQLAVSC